MKWILGDKASYGWQQSLLDPINSDANVFPADNTHGAQATVEYSVQVQKESQSLVRHMRCQYALRMARKKCFCDFDVFLLCQDVSPMACH